MQISFTEKKNIRKNFGKLQESLSIPNLIEVQKNSYRELTDLTSENKDITLSPRLFNDDKFLLQSEFRQKNKKSYHVADLSQFVSNDKSSKGHLFYNFKKKVKSKNCGYTKTQCQKSVESFIGNYFVVNNHYEEG